MAAKVRVKVSKDTLLAKVRAAKTAAEAKHKADTIEYEANQKNVKSLTLAALRDAIKVVQGGGKLCAGQEYIERKYTDCVYVPCDAKPNEQPPKLNLAPFNQDIALLEMAADDFFTLSTDDHFSRYIK